MKRGVGRPMAALVPGDAERSFPERRARRRRMSRSLSERCRMILRCADGVPNMGRRRNWASTGGRWANGGAAS